jgi:hypothetical protein
VEYGGRNEPSKQKAAQSGRPEALRLWRRKELHAKLAEGYRSMADEDRETAERNVMVSSVSALASNESTNNQ